MSTDETASSAQTEEGASKPMDRRRFLKYGVAGIIGAGAASAIEIPVLTNMVNSDSTKVQQLQNQVNSLNSQVSSLTSQVNSDQTQISTLQNQVTSSQAIIDFSITEQKELEAIVETVIPTDSAGPGAKEAGVVYFIANQISTDYGSNARMYMKAPFVRPGLSGPITVDGITYSAGTYDVPFSSGMKYQYNLTLREFWRLGLEALETYSNSVLGKNFEALNVNDRTSMLNDLYDNKPTSFNGIVPRDFFQEVLLMTWSGFFMDPAYGGNIGMVGWKLTGFTGANMGDAFNTGRDVLKLMVASTPTRYEPHSLGEYQKTLQIITGGTSS